MDTNSINTYGTSSINSIIIKDLKNKDTLSNQAKAYIIYIKDGSKYIDLFTYSLFSHTIGQVDNIIFGGRAYYQITNSDIANIDRVFGCIPGRISFLDNDLDFKLNYNKVNSKYDVPNESADIFNEMSLIENRNVDLLQKNEELRNVLNEIEFDDYDNNKNNIHKM